MEHSTKYVLTPFPCCQMKCNKFVEFLKCMYSYSSTQSSYQLDQFYGVHSVAFPNRHNFCTKPHSRIFTPYGIVRSPVITPAGTSPPSLVSLPPLQHPPYQVLSASLPVSSLVAARLVHSFILVTPDLFYFGGFFFFFSNTFLVQKCPCARRLLLCIHASCFTFSVLTLNHFLPISSIQVLAIYSLLARFEAPQGSTSAPGSRTDNLYWLLWVRILWSI